MTKTKESQDVVTRPAAKALGQRIPAGVSHLLGDGGGGAEPPAPKRRSRREAEGSEARVTFALRYRESYMDRLEHLYLRERASRRKLAKADLVEEALDLLFAKYKVA